MIQYLKKERVINSFPKTLSKEEEESIIRYLKHKIKEEIIDSFPKTLSKEEEEYITKYIIKYALHKEKELFNHHLIRVGVILDVANIDSDKFFEKDIYRIRAYADTLKSINCRPQKV